MAGPSACVRLAAALLPAPLEVGPWVWSLPFVAVTWGRPLRPVSLWRLLRRPPSGCALLPFSIQTCRSLRFFSIQIWTRKISNCAQVVLEFNWGKTKPSGVRAFVANRARPRGGSQGGEIPRHRLGAGEYHSRCRCGVFVVLSPHSQTSPILPPYTVKLHRSRVVTLPRE